MSDPAIRHFFPRLPTSVGRPAAIPDTFVLRPTRLTAARPHGPLRLAEPDPSPRPLPASLGLLAGCGGGTDGTPLPPPTTPDPTPPPAPPSPATRGVPTGLRVSARGGDFIEWTWNAVEGASGYDVQFSLDVAFTDEDEIVARTSEELSFRREDLSPGTSAYLRVRSASGDGDDRVTSAWSAQVTGVATPLPPGLRQTSSLRPLPSVRSRRESGPTAR